MRWWTAESGGRLKREVKGEAERRSKPHHRNKARKCVASQNVERGVQNLEFVLQQMHRALTALTSSEANDTVACSRKNPLEAWR